MNIANMMKQAQQMQQRMAEMQTQLAGKTVESSVAGGKIKVTANGHGEVTAISIAPEVIDPADPALLEDLVLSAVRQAIEKAKETAAAEMKKITGGMGLPPGLGF